MCLQAFNDVCANLWSVLYIILLHMCLSLSVQCPGVRTVGIVGGHSGGNAFPSVLLPNPMHLLKYASCAVVVASTHCTAHVILSLCCQNYRLIACKHSIFLSGRNCVMFRDKPVSMDDEGPAAGFCKHPLWTRRQHPVLLFHTKAWMGPAECHHYWLCRWNCQGEYTEKSERGLQLWQSVIRIVLNWTVWRTYFTN